MKNKNDVVGLIPPVLLGTVLVIGLIVMSILANDYSNKAIIKEAKTIEYFKAGKVLVCKPNLTEISNDDWKYANESRAFSKDKVVLKAINCGLKI